MVPKVQNKLLFVSRSRLEAAQVRMERMKELRASLPGAPETKGRDSVQILGAKPQVPTLIVPNFGPPVATSSFVSHEDKTVITHAKGSDTGTGSQRRWPLYKFLTFSLGNQVENSEGYISTANRILGATPSRRQGHLDLEKENHWALVARFLEDDQERKKSYWASFNLKAVA